MAVIAGKTISKVVKDGLCTGCGTCVGICPKDAIQMVKDESKGIYLPQLDGAKCNECGICLKACPGCEVDFKTLAIEIFGKEAEDILLGNYLSCYIGHATDYDIRYNSASGGLVTALLIYALEEGIIDGALVTTMSQEDPLEPQPFIARTREEIISASKSKYCPVPANIALNEIVNAKEGERFAVVGLPCHIQGIRKAEMVDKKLKDRIALHLGLFCNHAPSFLAIEYILSKKGIKKEEVKRLDYRGEGWPGFMKIDLGEKLLFLLIHDYWASGFGSFFYPLRCTLCCDQSSELADISFADAWLPELSDDKVGSSMIISRSAVGAEILQRAAAKGKVTLNEIPVRKVVETQWAGLHFKKTVEARFSLLRVTGRKEMPAYNTKLLKPGFRSRVDAILLFSRRYAASKRHLWRIIYLWCFLKSLPIKVLKMVGLYKTAAVLRRKLIKFSQ